MMSSFVSEPLSRQLSSELGSGALREGVGLATWVGVAEAYGGLEPT